MVKNWTFGTYEEFVNRHREVYKSLKKKQFIGKQIKFVLKNPGEDYNLTRGKGLGATNYLRRETELKFIITDFSKGSFDGDALNFEGDGGQSVTVSLLGIDNNKIDIKFEGERRETKYGIDTELTTVEISDAEMPFKNAMSADIDGGRRIRSRKVRRTLKNGRSRRSRRIR